MRTGLLVLRPSCGRIRLFSTSGARFPACARYVKNWPGGLSTAPRCGIIAKCYTGGPLFACFFVRTRTSMRKGETTMSEIIRSIEREQLRTDRPDFRVGDTVRVFVKVVEGSRERLQAFEGT